jgi:NAD(P)-dependent dehydrogenase (short-subunit alcohol dehydrogenase family)
MSQPSSPGTVLITGAAKRIGKALALDLGARGWNVAVHYSTSAKDAGDVVAAIEAMGSKAIALDADLANAEATLALVGRAAAALGPVTCLINNASLFEKDMLPTLTVQSWDEHLDINLRAPALLTQGFAAQLPEGASGNVINIIDQRVWNLTEHFFSYTISKAGLWAMTQSAALALAPRIRVNGIGPGPILPSSRQSQADFDRQCAATPLQRGSSPEEICDAVRYILKAPAMTGQMIALDGGSHLTWRAATVTE